MKIVCEIQMLNGADVRVQADVFAAFVETLVEVNRIVLRASGAVAAPATSLYASGVRFQEDARWQDVTSMRSTGYGDCKDLVAWRLAELRGQGVDARLHVIFSKAGGTDVFHMVVLHPGGQLEDVAAIVRSVAAGGTALVPPGGLRIVR